MGATTPVSISLSNPSHLLAFDAFHAKILLKILLIICTYFPYIAGMLILYYIVISFSLVFLSDRSVGGILAWSGKTVINLLIISVLLGAFAKVGKNSTSVLPFINSDMIKKLVSSPINGIYTYKPLPSKEATVEEINPFGQTSFDLYAYSLYSSPIGTLAQLNVENLATFTAYDVQPSVMKLYTMKAGGSYESDVGNALNNLSNSQNIESSDTIVSASRLGNSIMFLFNSFSSMSYAVGHLMDIQRIRLNDIAAMLKNLFKGSPSPASGFTFKSIFANLKENIQTHSFAYLDNKHSTQKNSTILAAIGDTLSSSTSVISPSLNTYPGGVYEYTMYAMRRVANPNLIYAANALPLSKKLVKAVTKGKDVSLIKSSSTAASTTSGCNENALADSVPSQMYLRTHVPIFIKNCRMDLGLNDSTPQGDSIDSQGILSIADPCKIKIKTPAPSGFSVSTKTAIAGTVNELLNKAIGSASTQFNNLVTSVVKGLGDVASGMIEDATGGLGGHLTGAVSKLGGKTYINKATSSLTGLIVQSVQQLQGSITFKNTSCNSPTDYSSAITLYDQLLTTSTDPQFKVSRPCLEMGCKLIVASKKIYEKANKNEDTYFTLIYNDPGGGLDTESSIDDTSPEDFGKPFGGLFNDYLLGTYASTVMFSTNQIKGIGNFADLSSVLRQMFSKFDPTYMSLSKTAATPNTYASERHKESLKMQTVVTGAGATTGTAAVLYKLLSNAKNWFKGGFKILSGMKGAITKVGSKVLSFLEGPIKFIQYAIMFIPMLGVLMFYVIGYFMTTVGSVLGLGTLPIWSVMMFGKALTNTAGADEQRQDMSLFPIMRFLFIPLGIGLEIVALSFASGQVMNFINDILSHGFNFVKAIFGAYANATVGIQVMDPLAAMSQAFTPLGVTFGMGMLPVLIHQLAFGREYSPMSQNAFNLQPHSFMPIQAQGHQLSQMFSSVGKQLHAPQTSAGAGSTTGGASSSSHVTTAEEAAARAKMSHS